MSNKPLFFTNDDIAEGVYAASGNPMEPASGGVEVRRLEKPAENWGDGWASTFTGTLPSGLSNHIVVTIVFSDTVIRLQGGGDAQCNGKTGTLDLWGSGSTITFTAVSSNQSLSVVSCKVENA